MSQKIKHKYFRSPTFGVVAAENGTFQAVVRRGDQVSVSDKRLPYGKAFAEAHKMAGEWE